MILSISLCNILIMRRENKMCQLSSQWAHLVSSKCIGSLIFILGFPRLLKISHNKKSHNILLNYALLNMEDGDKHIARSPKEGNSNKSHLHAGDPQALARNWVEQNCIAFSSDCQVFICTSPCDEQRDLHFSCSRRITYRNEKYLSLRCRKRIINARNFKNDGHLKRLFEAELFLIVFPSGGQDFKRTRLTCLLIWFILPLLYSSSNF